VIGDVNHGGQLQNIQNGAAPDDTSVILRVRQDGTPAPGNPFHPYCSVTTTTQCDSDDDCPGGQVCRKQNLRYYAYGVRNSFGLALDPVTGALWDTENGPDAYDEINYVAPGANSGWVPLMGPDSRDPQVIGDLFHMPAAGITYSDPEFSWLSPIAPTAIAFPYGSSLGPAYDDKVIVSDVVVQQLYAFPLNATRTGFDLAGIPGLADAVADSAAERDALRIGTGFPATDIEVGPDRHLYLVRIAPGAIFRIRGPEEVTALPLGAAALLPLVLAAFGVHYAIARRRPA
jgi:glucose/arabinose dehydrogenase